MDGRPHRLISLHTLNKSQVEFLSNGAFDVYLSFNPKLLIRWRFFEREIFVLRGFGVVELGQIKSEFY